MFIINNGVQDSLIHYSTARIDIKNSGKSNQIEFLYISDNNSKLEFPDWFKNSDGVGAVIESSEGILDLKIRCINDGNLILRLRGVDFRSNDMRIPIFINFKSIIVNGVQQINGNKVVSHDDIYECKVNVYDGDIVFIHVESSPIKV